MACKLYTLIVYGRPYYYYRKREPEPKIRVTFFIFVLAISKYARKKLFA